MTQEASMSSAAVTAARTGRVVAFALAGIGLLESLMTGALNGIWLALHA